MEKVKVLHLELDAHMGGIESFLYNLYSQIDREHVQFDFVTRSNCPAMESELRKLGAKIYRVSSYKKPLTYMRDLNTVIENGYDVIHVHKNSAAVILPFIVAHKHKNIRVFVHSHNTRPSVNGISKALHMLNKGILWRYSDEHFACSEVAGKWLYGNKKFTIIRNGIVAEKFRFTDSQRIKKRNELSLEEDSFVIGHVGRFTYQKNHWFLIDIFNEVSRMKEKSILLLIGEGENREKIECKVKELGLGDKVRFLGNRSDIPQLLMSMDAFVMPSLYEGLPISAVEAQATGVNTFLADTISKETELSSAVTWFSIDDKASDIAKIIIEKCKKENDRLLCNAEVIKAGFAMENTAKMLQDAYNNARTENLRKEGKTCTL